MSIVLEFVSFRTGQNTGNIPGVDHRHAEIPHGPARRHRCRPIHWRHSLIDGTEPSR